jgi:predicted nucleic acid-binding protein
MSDRPLCRGAPGIRENRRYHRRIARSMISAIDTSVLFDIFLPDPTFVKGSHAAVREAFAAGALVICEAVYAELASRFASQPHLDEVLNESQIRVEPVGRAAAFLAGQMFHAYRTMGGKRDRIITDFLIGSHAAQQAGRLVTRDRGFYRQYFGNLTVIDPTARNEHKA